MPTSLLQLTNISKEYTDQAQHTQVLRGVSLQINHGEFVAIMGPSGSGKSTLLNIIGLLDTPTAGTYLLDNVSVHDLPDARLAALRRQSIGFIFQSFNLLPRLSVVQNVELPMIYSGRSTKERRARALDLLSRVGLSDRASYRPNQLSGGQMQRVAIARALANEPKLILADEPTGNLDSVSSQSVLDLLTKLNHDGVTLIVVTHNPEIADLTGRTIRVRDGRLEGQKS